MAKLEILDQAKNFYGNLGKTQKIAAFGAAIAVLAVILIVVLSLSTSKRYAVLYSNLSEKDAAQIVEKLKENNVDYELKNGGETILVPEKKVYDLRLRMASAGLPEESVAGYEIFDKTNLGMSEFVQKINYRRALEGEIARTIMSSDQIKKARVHIVIPEKTLFEKDQKKPTASIVLTLKSKMSKSYIDFSGIQKLVAASVEGLSPDDVIITDERGKVLSEIEPDKKTIAGKTAAQYELQRQVEEYLTRKAQSMLDAALGVGNSEVRVTADLDFEQIEKTKTLYDAENQAVRSEQQISSSNSALDTVPNYGVINKQSQQNNITNYEIPTTVEKVVNEVGNVKRLTVAIAVNGKDTVIQGKDGDIKLINLPPSQKKLNDIKTLVENAVGFDAGRGDNIEVKYVPFEIVDKDEIIREYYSPKWWERPLYVKFLALGVLTLIMIYLLYRLLQSKYVKDRIRIALSLPEKVEIEEEEEAAEEEEEPEEILLDEEDLSLLPAELPDQLLVEGERPELITEGEPLEEEEGFDKESLAARAEAGLVEAEDLSEEAMMKLELKNKVENFISEETEEAVKLVRYFLAMDIEKGLL